MDIDTVLVLTQLSTFSIPCVLCLGSDLCEWCFSVVRLVVNLPHMTFFTLSALNGALQKSAFLLENNPHLFPECDIPEYMLVVVTWVPLLQTQLAPMWPICEPDPKLLRSRFSCHLRLCRNRADISVLPWQLCSIPYFSTAGSLAHLCLHTCGSV